MLGGDGWIGGRTTAPGVCRGPLWAGVLSLLRLSGAIARG